MTEYHELVTEAAEARAGADRMEAGLPCIPDPVYGDLETVKSLMARVAMIDWQTMDTCPEGRRVLVYASWNEPDVIWMDEFRWVEYSEWETVSESSGAPGARRQIRQERIIREREWGRGGQPEFWAEPNFPKRN